MEGQQEATTQATETETPELSAEDIVGAALPGFGQGGGDETDGAAPSGQPSAAAKTADEQAQKNDPESALRNDALFSEQALASKGGILHARQALLETRKHQRSVADHQHGVHVRQEKREARLRNDRQEYNRRVTAFQAVEKARQADVDLLINGSGDEALHALGRLARKSGVETYEALTAAVLGQKKAPKEKSPELEELRNELKGLREGLTEKQKQQESEQVAQKRTEWLQSIAQLAESNLDKLPGIQHALRSNPKVGREIMQWIHNEHLADINDPDAEVRSREQLIMDAEAELVKLVPQERPAAPKKPASAGRPFGSAPSATRAATNGKSKSVFEMNDDERLAALAGEDGILSSLGLMR